MGLRAGLECFTLKKGRKDADAVARIAVFSVRSDGFQEYIYNK